MYLMTVRFFTYCTTKWYRREVRNIIFQHISTTQLLFITSYTKKFAVKFLLDEYDHHGDFCWKETLIFVDIFPENTRGHKREMYIFYWSGLELVCRMHQALCTKDKYPNGATTGEQVKVFDSKVSWNTLTTAAKKVDDSIPNFDLLQGLKLKLVRGPHEDL